MATIDSFSGLCGWRAGQLANSGLTHQKHKMHKNDLSVGSRAHPPLTLDSQLDHLIQKVGGWGSGGELFPPWLGLLLFTFAKSAFKRPPPQKRHPLPSLRGGVWGILLTLWSKNGRELRPSSSQETLPPCWRPDPVSPNLPPREWLANSPAAFRTSSVPRKNLQPRAELQLSGRSRLPLGAEHHYYP